MTPEERQKYIEQMKQQTKMADIQSSTQLAMAKLQLDAAKADATIKKLEAEAIKLLAEADGVDTGHAIAMINAELAAQKQHKDSLMTAIELMHDIEMDYQKKDSGKGEEQQPM